MVANALVVLAILLGPLIGEDWLGGFRGYFSYDQLSYAAIASNVSVGASGFVEPFTLTGTSYYPSLWYQVIGVLARISGLPVYVLWTVLGLLVVSAAVLTCRVAGVPALAVARGRRCCRRWPC